MAPDDSTANGWKMKRRPNIAYLANFLTSAASATDPAASATNPVALATNLEARAARVSLEDAKVSTRVASQLRHRPRE